MDEDERPEVEENGVEEQPKQLLPGPATFLQEVIGHSVVVRLNSGVDYRGVLNCLDGFMNLVLEGAQELVGGRVKNTYGDCFIRGNNVMYITRLP